MDTARGRGASLRTLRRSCSSHSRFGSPHAFWLLVGSLKTLSLTSLNTIRYLRLVFAFASCMPKHKPYVLIYTIVSSLSQHETTMRRQTATPYSKRRLHSSPKRMGRSPTILDALQSPRFKLAKSKRRRTFSVECSYIASGANDSRVLKGNTTHFRPKNTHRWI